MNSLLQRLVLLLAAICITLVLIAIGGGIRYSSRTVFKITDTSEDNLTVHIQDSAATSWGNPDVISYSVYEAPYTVYLSSNLPSDSNFSQAIIRTATVQGDGALIARVKDMSLRVSPVTVHRLASITEVPGFGPAALATFETLPHEVVVSGELLLSGSNEKTEKSFVRRFPVFRVQELQLGPWVWKRTTPPPNPSIEGDVQGLSPSAAPHVKR
jgi:hypothetical protein